MLTYTIAIGTRKACISVLAESLNTFLGGVVSTTKTLPFRMQVLQNQSAYHFMFMLQVALPMIPGCNRINTVLLGKSSSHIVKISCCGFEKYYYGLKCSSVLKIRSGNLYIYIYVGLPRK